jgi:hypothetical protein
VEAGVYYLLGRHRSLLYVGKAVDLDRRLADHARDSRWWGDVVDVRWEVMADEHAALVREADVIVALRPPRNRAGIAEQHFSFVSIGAKGLVFGRDGGDYGVFPHLGRGAGLRPGRHCMDGFKALEHVVRATTPDGALLHAFLSGHSDRLLRTPLDHVDQPHVRHGIERDRAEARLFYDAGPKAMRALRRRHGGRGVVTKEQFVGWIRAEVDEVLA